MNCLLDTHALLWWMHEPAALSDRAAAVIRDRANSIFVSAVSAMEIAIKSRRGRLEYETPLAEAFSAALVGEGFLPLDITVDHAQRAGTYPGAHADPWDRLLAAQSEMEGLRLVSCDPQIATLGVTTLW